MGLEASRLLGGSRCNCGACKDEHETQHLRTHQKSLAPNISIISVPASRANYAHCVPCNATISLLTLEATWKFEDILLPFNLQHFATSKTTRESNTIP